MRKNLERRLERLESEVQRHQRIHLRKPGCNSKHGSYDLRSFDGGLTWYATDPTEDGLEILGKADEIFPGLIGEIKGMEQLTNYVKEHGGPVSLTGKNAELERHLLEDAGFQVIEG